MVVAITVLPYLSQHLIPNNLGEDERPEIVPRRRDDGDIGGNCHALGRRSEWKVVVQQQPSCYSRVLRNVHRVFVAGDRGVGSLIATSTRQ